MSFWDTGREPGNAPAAFLGLRRRLCAGRRRGLLRALLLRPGGTPPASHADGRPDRRRLDRPGATQAVGPPDFGEYRGQIVASPRRPRYARAFSRTTRTNRAAAEARLADITVPALIVIGDQDPDFPDHAAETAWIAQAIHAQVVMVPEAGHYPSTSGPTSSPTLSCSSWQRCCAVPRPDRRNPARREAVLREVNQSRLQTRSRRSGPQEGDGRSGHSEPGHRVAGDPGRCPPGIRIGIGGAEAGLAPTARSNAAVARRESLTRCGCR